MSRIKEYEMPLTFIDFEKAFNSIYSRAVIDALINQKIEKPYVETLANIYRVAKAKIKKPQNFQLPKDIPLALYINTVK